MPAGICVFDLDNTLGDFRGIDYFGYIFEPKLVLEPSDVLPYMEKYGEKLVIATQAPNELTVNMLYVNFETQTSSWILHDLRTDEYCMVGAGKATYIPDDSPLKNVPIGQRT